MAPEKGLKLWDVGVGAVNPWSSRAVGFGIWLEGFLLCGKVSVAEWLTFNVLCIQVLLV